MDRLLYNNVFQWVLFVEVIALTSNSFIEPTSMDCREPWGLYYTDCNRLLPIGEGKVLFRKLTFKTQTLWQVKTFCVFYKLQYITRYVNTDNAMLYINKNFVFNYVILKQISINGSFPTIREAIIQKNAWLISLKSPQIDWIMFTFISWWIKFILKSWLSQFTQNEREIHILFIKILLALH